MAKVTYPDGSTRNVTAASKTNDLQDYIDQSRAAGRSVDVSATAGAFDQLAGGGPAGTFPSAGSSYQPGGGNGFFAGLEELFNKPSDFAKDATGIGTATYLPTSPGGGNAFLAGAEELFQKPRQFLDDLGVPSSATLIVMLALGVAAIGGVAYIAHKVL